jgi:hypothetical protein
MRHLRAKLLSGAALACIVAAGCGQAPAGGKAPQTLKAITAAAPETSYEIRRDDDTSTSTLVVSIGGKTFDGPSAGEVVIATEEDFNGDGTLDALVTTGSGGNAVEPECSIVSFLGGRVVAAPLDGGCSDYQTVREGNQVRVAVKGDEGQVVWGFDGARAVKVREVKADRLKASAEIVGVGAHYSRKDLTRTLNADLDGDGKRDRVVCEIWPRWGIYSSCELPLPNGRSQSLEFNPACERVGVLDSARNGRRELVCNGATVIFFDGRAWQQEPPKK